MKIEKQIIQLLLENDLRLRGLYDLEYRIEDQDELKVALELIGEYEEKVNENEKDRTECIETTVVHFKKYNLFIKEVSVGDCHYKDVMIDGYSESEYFLVEPKEVMIIDYVNDVEI